MPRRLCLPLLRTTALCTAPRCLRATTHCCTASRMHRRVVCREQTVPCCRTLGLFLLFCAVLYYLLPFSGVNAVGLA
jgi:hypothetical protein